MELTTKRKLIDTLGYGLILWLIGFALGMLLFPFVPVSLIGLPILAVLIPVTIFVAYKRFKKISAPSSYYLLVAVVWVLFPVILDYLFLVKAFNVQNYYDLDLIVYYISTFLIPLVIGLKYGNAK